MRKYRIKSVLREDTEAWLNTPYMDVAPKYNVYMVQMRVWWLGWITIKEFDDKCDREAHSRAMNLIDELNKEVL